MPGTTDNIIWTCCSWTNINHFAFVWQKTNQKHAFTYCFFVVVVFIKGIDRPKWKFCHYNYELLFFFLPWNTLGEFLRIFSIYDCASLTSTYLHKWFLELDRLLNCRIQNSPSVFHGKQHFYFWANYSFKSSCNRLDCFNCELQKENAKSFNQG